ncbi:transglutaminase family protein [Rhizobiaceae bacterium BDR2-2]|uniref:Transglutaminase family protein n=1 Tax=Ectorhizobium quercum TaxID=2965071 RepID=A0AAE3SVL2_9HYPH|nr:transglutaminase family protein [Ectorhizobium quercum]MCX8996505.1 transglutaminase family protein [Ectorhizobium quercum]
MRLKITHKTEYVYDQPVPYTLQRLRLTPLSDRSQTVLDWSVKVKGAQVEVGFSDQFGNRNDLVSVDGDRHAVRILAAGTVDTIDTNGVTGPHQGFVPLWLYLRETPRTRAGKLVRELARGITGDGELARMHALMETIHETIAYMPGTTDSETTAEQALEAKKGVCQDHAHLFIATARVLGIPARYVSGYLWTEETPEQIATHAWAEAHIPALGWVGFDPANDICPDERYVRIATGLCYRDCAPVSGLRIGNAEETLTVSLTVVQEQSQSQS